MMPFIISDNLFFSDFGSSKISALNQTVFMYVQINM